MLQRKQPQRACLLLRQSNEQHKYKFSRIFDY